MITIGTTFFSFLFFLSQYDQCTSNYIPTFLTSWYSPFPIRCLASYKCNVSQLQSLIRKNVSDQRHRIMELFGWKIWYSTNLSLLGRGRLIRFWIRVNTAVWKLHHKQRPLNFYSFHINLCTQPYIE